jgi:threonine/homoserine/homoserine lactone efflux protein
MTTEFWITSLLITATPGTGVVFTLAAALARGARASVVAAIGCTLGTVPHLVAAISGAAAILAASATAFEVLRWAGVAYLLFMAWGAWRRTGALTVGDAPSSTARTIGTAVTVNLLNPKLTVFFFAFLPQFVPNDGSPTVPRMLALGGMFMALTLVVFVGYGLAAAAVRERVITRPRVMTWINRTFATSFVALGMRLATSSR